VGSNLKLAQFWAAIIHTVKYEKLINFFVGALNLSRSDRNSSGVPYYILKDAHTEQVLSVVMEKSSTVKMRYSKNSKLIQNPWMK
jgi:hypothetical protein